MSCRKLCARCAGFTKFEIHSDNAPKLEQLQYHPGHPCRQYKVEFCLLLDFGKEQAGISQLSSFFPIHGTPIMVGFDRIHHFISNKKSIPYSFYLDDLV